MSMYRATTPAYMGKTPIKVTRNGVESEETHIMQGDIFQWSGKPALWMEAVDVSRVIVEKQDPLTFSEMQKMNPPPAPAKLDQPEEVQPSKKKPGRKKAA